MNKASKASAKSPAPSLAPEQAHNIWLAGLGAWSKAQAEGNKVFEALVRDGLNLQRQTQTMANAGFSQATEIATMTAHGRLDKLGGLFEARVAQAMAQLGLPGVSDWHTAQARIAKLEAQLADLQPEKAEPSASASAPAKTQAAPKRPRAPATPRKSTG